MKRYAVLLALAVSLLLVQAAAAELVTNGGFETGNFNGWTLAVTQPNNTGVAGPLPLYYQGIIHTGDYGAFLGEYPELGFLSQTIATTPGSSYNVGFWLRSGYDEDQEQIPNQFQASWGGIIIPGSSLIDITSTTYTHYEFTQVGGPGISTVLEFGFSDDNYFLYLDDVSVNPVPIPGAVWLLGSGLVGLAGLRRKFKS